MQKTQLDALLCLLDDNNNEIFENVLHQLCQCTVDDLPYLRFNLNESISKVFIERLSLIITNIETKKLLGEIELWKNKRFPSLIEGALLFNQILAPELNKDAVKELISKIKRDIWLELNDRLTALEKVRIINHILFTTHKYKAGNPNEPTNWDGLLNKVLEKKRGNYIITAILYAGIAQELGLPVKGISLPGSVLLCFEDNDINAVEKDKILFYLNPIDRGAVFGKKDLSFILNKKSIESKDEYYFPCSNQILIQRLLEHEIVTLKKLKQEKYLYKLHEIYKALKH